MDPRLVPLNGVLALLAPGEGDAWPNELAKQGYRLYLLEGDVQSDPQSVRVDVIAIRTNPDVILLIECKGGRSIRPAQARAYTNATVEGLRRRATLPSELQASSDVAVAAVFAGRDDEGEVLAESLEREHVSAPLLLVGEGGATLRGSTTPGLDDFAVRDVKWGHPPGRILVDHESPVDEVRQLLIPAVIAAMAQGEEAIDLQDAAGEIHPYWPQLGRVAQGEFMNLVKDAARGLANDEMRLDVRYESSNAISPRLTFTARPSEADPRGAAQAWQGLARHAAGTTGRKPHRHIEGQMTIAFDDVADEAVPPETEDVPVNESEILKDDHG